jgi:DNA helicase-2/ATP-dependent DNA helicase PcrA
MKPGKVATQIVQAMGAEPTEEQWRAISWPLEPCVLIAGAGSGKTSVMAARVVYLALVALGHIDADHGGSMPGNVMCLTFTNKATENLRQRVRHALSTLDLPEGEEPEILNYHGFASSLIERYGVLAGYEPDVRVLTEAQRYELCSRVLDQMTFEHASATFQPSLVGKILELDGQAQNHRVTPETLIEWVGNRLELLKKHRSDKAYLAAQERLELAEAARRYRQLKLELGVIDYGDLIDRGIDVVRRHPEVVTDHRARFHAVLLDEYQDTDVAQAELMVELFGDGHPVTAVGDPDQNIYAWRGASLYNLLEFPTRFPKADGTPAARLPLYTNFRSGARILAAADQIISPVPEKQRPAPDKELRPHPPNGQGEVHVTRFEDEWTEACAIADRAVHLHEAGAVWSEIAVLCRRSSLFDLLLRACEDRGVPVEVVGLAGLLKQPEVVEVLCYARAVQDPTASAALARILMGPRYRVGFKDLAMLARMAADKDRQIRDEYELSEDDAEAVPFLPAEALERVEEAERISDEGRARLLEFRDELARLRVEARKPVGEFLSEIIRVTGLAEELDAALDRRRALAARRNLASFLDEVNRFEPVEGELTLRAFLDYVDDVDRTGGQEWAPVQPSDEDSIKVMTIHQAKGLEFDHVFVPGMAHDILPNPRIPQNPAERGKSLDFELRGDAAVLPRFEGNLSAFSAALKAQEIVEERRTAYVAMTRARRSLHATGSFWYGDNNRPKKPSLFLDELMDWGEHTGLAKVDRGPEGASDENPLLGFRASLVRDWPGPARPVASDPAFEGEGGWRGAALDAAARGGVQGGLLQSLDPADRASFQQIAAERRELAAHLLEREAVDAAAGDGSPRAPASLSASALIEYSNCPKRFYWTVVRPLPRFSGPGARIGTQIHRWIERRASGQGQLLEDDDPVDLTSEELAGDPGTTQRLREAFLGSRFGDQVPLYAERPFLLRIGDHAVSGRIDAIYGMPDGPWEVVDWKTGSGLADPLQLELYGLACVEIWGKRAEDLTLTYCYLRRGEIVSQPMTDPAELRERLAGSLASIASGDLSPRHGPICTYCDFNAFCDAGQEWLTSGSGS